MNHLKKFRKKDKISESQRPRIINGAVATDYQKFILDYIENLSNSFIISTLNRMIETNNYIKFGKEVYKLTDEEKEKIQKLKPKLHALLVDIEEIKKNSL